MLGSNSADTAGNRARAPRRMSCGPLPAAERRGKGGLRSDGTTDLATLVSRANNDFGQAKPARFAADAFAAKGAPVYPASPTSTTSMRERMQGARTRRNRLRFGTLSPGRGGAPTPDDLVVSRMAQRYRVNFAKNGNPTDSVPTKWPRHVAGDGKFSISPMALWLPGPTLGKPGWT